MGFATQPANVVFVKNLQKHCLLLVAIDWLAPTFAEACAYFRWTSPSTLVYIIRANIIIIYNYENTRSIWCPLLLAYDFFALN